MKLILCVIQFFLLNSFTCNFCQDYSEIKSKDYAKNFPDLQNYDNKEILQKIQTFDYLPQKGKGGNGIVKTIELQHKTGQSQRLAIKKTVIKPENIFFLEEEIKYWNKVQDSPYVPNFYACFGDEYNNLHENQKTFYIIQEHLDFDLGQDQFIYSELKHDLVQNPRNIKNALPKQLDRIAFYIQIFEAIDFFESKHVIHNDIKPQNIMVGDKGYKGHPYLIDFGLADSLNESPVQSTICYEFKGKNNFYMNKSKFDVYSAGVSIIELENEFSDFCEKFYTQYQNNYNTFNITQSQMDFFNNLVMKLLGVNQMKPDCENVFNCDSLECILLFTVQEDINIIPEAKEVSTALKSLYNRRYSFYI